MTNIACQLGKVYDHLRDKLLGMPVMEFTDLTFHWEDSPNTWVLAMVWDPRLNEEAQSGWALALVPLCFFMVRATGAGASSSCCPAFPAVMGTLKPWAVSSICQNLRRGKKHVAPSLAACFRFSSSLSVPYKPSWRCRERFPWQRCDFSIAGIDGKDLFGPY